MVQINNAGGIGGHELKLITCNDERRPQQGRRLRPPSGRRGRRRARGRLHRQRRRDHADPRGRPASRGSGRPASPRRAVQRGTATRSPPACWVWPAWARWRPRTGATTVASVELRPPSAGQIAQLVDLALTNQGHDPSTLIKVPPTTTDFSTIAQETSDYDCAVVGTPPQPFLGIAAAGAQLGSTTKYYLRARRPHRPVATQRRRGGRGREDALELPRRRATRSGTRPRSTSATWPTTRTAAGPRSTSRTPGSPTAPSCR